MDDDALIAHLPLDRACAAVHGGSIDGHRHGAVLFADIVGFTPMSRRLTERLGTRGGTEELTLRLNAVYDRVVDIVHGHGGAIVEFSGDGVMCWFDDHPTPARTTPEGEAHPRRELAGRSGTVRAASCGAALQSAVAVLRVASSSEEDALAEPIAIKVTIATGEVVRAEIGDPAIRRLDVIAGEAVSRVTSMPAEAGEVVLDPASIAALDGHRFEATDTADRAGDPPAPWWGPAPRRALAVARTWCDHRLRDRSLPLTELRPTVSVFLRFDGFEDLREPAFVDRLDTYVRHVQHRLALDDGNLVQVSMGEKGNYLYVAFGAPLAHDDLADRAVRAALDLAAGFPDAGIGPTAIGIAQGISRTGTYGGRRRRTYGALGDATNLAARLMARAAPGEVVVTDLVQRGCVGGVAFDEPEPITVKGFDGEVLVAKVAGRRAVGAAGRRFDATLIGRERELQQLSDALLRATAGAGPGAVVVVEGDAGIGKSRLVDAAREIVVDTAAVTWLSSGATTGSRAGLGPFVSLLREVLFLDLAEVEQRRALLDLGIDAITDDLGRAGHHREATALDGARSFLAALLGIRWEDSPFERSAPASRFDRSLRAVEVFLRAEALRRPLVLHLRDLHWFDADARRVLDLLAAATREVPMALLLDRRPTDDETAWSAPAMRTMTLGALDRTCCREQAEHLLGERCAPALVDAVYRRSAGNPFFTEQLVLDLRERGVLTRTGGAVDLSADALTDVPLSLQATLLSRLDRLPELVRDLVQSAAVLGDRFDTALLAAMASIDAHAFGFAELLAIGERAGLWLPLDGGRFGFVHALLRDAAYAMQPERRLRLRHAAAADALTVLQGNDPARAGEIGEHHARAGRPWRAAVQFRRAARLAAASHAYREAIASTERALDVLTGVATAPTRARLAETAGDFALAGGHPSPAVRYYRAALEGGRPDVPLGDSPADGRRAQRLTGLGDAYERLGQSAEAVEAYEAALGAVGDSGELELMGRIYAGLSHAQLRAGATASGIELGELALALAAAGSAADVARAHTTLAGLFLASDELEIAERHAGAAAEVAEAANDPLAMGAARNTMGLVVLARDDAPAAASQFRDAVEAFRVAGNEAGEARALDNLAQALMRCGDEEGAMTHLAAAVEILSRIAIDAEGIQPALWKSGLW